MSSCTMLRKEAEARQDAEARGVGRGRRHQKGNAAEPAADAWLRVNDPCA